MRPPSSTSLPEIMRHLEDQSANLVHLRGGAPPVFWKGSERHKDQGGFAVLRTDDIKRFICVPLTDEQLANYRQRNFACLALRVRDIGAFHFEPNVQEGSEELLVASSERIDPYALFRSHHDLLAEARVSPLDGDVYWNLGVAFIDEGEYQLAWHAFEKANELAPNDSAIHVQIGKLLGHKLCRVDDAIAALERAVALPASPSEAYVELAVMFRSSHRPDDAEAAVRRGLDAHPDQGPLLEALGVILMELDRASDAIPVLERSLKLHGPDAEIQMLLTKARSALGPR